MSRLAVQTSLIRLRQDAKERNMPDLAIAYGWSAVRISGEIVIEASKVLEAEREANQRAK